MSNVIKIVIALIVLAIGVTMIQGVISLLNHILYQIIVHPLRSLIIVLTISAIYSLGTILLKES
jgi:predicted membrane protein